MPFSLKRRNSGNKKRNEKKKTPKRSNYKRKYKSLPQIYKFLNKQEPFIEIKMAQSDNFQKLNKNK